MKNLGNRLRARRQWLDLRQAELAKAAGVTWQQWQKYEHGRSDPPSATLLRLAGALNTTASHLLGESQIGHDRRQQDDRDALFADATIGAILRRLQGMDGKARKTAHALICAQEAIQ